LDRTAIGNAKLYGLQKGIGADDNQYRLALTLFFIPYALFEPATNALLKKIRPSWFFTAIIVLWGVVMMCQGFVTSPGGLYAARFFLGVTEAGLFPGVQLYLSFWYRRREFGLRSAIFFSAATAAGAFGGLLSAAIGQLDGVRGRGGWSWIFIILGAATIGIGSLSIWLTYDFPETATFLTEREREYQVARLRLDGQQTGMKAHLTLRGAMSAIFDIRTLLFAMVYVGADMPLYAFSLFTPTIVQGLGFKNRNIANLVSVPIYVLACVVTIVVGIVADRTGRRGFVNLIGFSVGITGYVILIASRNFGLSYFATYLAACGIYPMIANTVAWTANNIDGQYRRSLILGCVIAWGNLNGAVSSNVYFAKDKPWYRLGHGLVLLYLCLGFLFTALFMLYAKRENARRDRGESQKEIIGGEPPADGRTKDGKLWFATEDEARVALGDEWSGFRYTY